MAVVINRKAGTISMAAGDVLTVANSEQFTLDQVLWYAFTAAADDFLLSINGEPWIGYQAGAVAGGHRFPCHGKVLKSKDTLTLTTMDAGSILIQFRVNE